MSGAFWESIGLCIGMILGMCLFVLPIMLSCLKGPPDDEERPRGGGMVE
ncbi:hypothetical protein [Stenotrophomonas sp. GD03657]|nr:hypothetical protein [Stenotrophomonas sp. GD03657]MDH2154064.1 hypothetical protein [Stenotrophomonas sp. GD03657]